MDEAALRALLDDNVPRRIIAERLGLSPSTVSRHARLLGYPPRRQQPAKHDWPAVQAMLDAGEPSEACRRRFAISTSAWHAARERGALHVPSAVSPPRHGETRARVAQLLDQGMSHAAIADRLGLSRPTVSYHVRRLGLPVDERFSRRVDWAAVQALHDAGASARECRRVFGFAASSWTHAVRRGAIVPHPRAMPLEMLLSGPRNRNHVKGRLIRMGLKENRCERCGLEEWLGRPLSMALHHVNGVGDDNRLENLQLLCPNCHSQTENFAGRNRRAAGAPGGGGGAVEDAAA